MIFKSRERRRYTEAARAYEATQASHKEFSVISNVEPGAPSRRLIDLGLAAATRARDLPLRIYAGRPSPEPHWFEIWPGEHYRLLAALVATLDARRVVEIGTFTGMGSLALLETLPADGQLATFDIKPWRAFPDTWLSDEDFAGGRFVQRIADIAAPGVIGAHADVFEAADFIFIDGPKDGVTEPKFLAALEQLKLKPGVVVMFDDVRVLNMVALWRRLARPKLDLTSFGHWSGTGLVDWNG